LLGTVLDRKSVLREHERFKAILQKQAKTTIPYKKQLELHKKAFPLRERPFLPEQ